MEAIQLIEPLLEKGLKKPALTLEYAQCLFQDGQYKKSYQLLKEQMHLTKDNPEIRSFLAQVCIHSGYFSEAATLLNTE